MRRSPSNNSNYDVSTYPYAVVNLTNDFRLSDNSPLNPNSNLVQTVDCIKTGGSTAYATAIDKAQALLNAQGRSDAQDVIIFFTDGEANYGPWYYGNNSPYRKQPCAQAISSANAGPRPRAHGCTPSATTPTPSSAARATSQREARGRQPAPRNKGKQFPCDELAIKTAYCDARSRWRAPSTARLKFYWPAEPPAN